MISLGEDDAGELFMTQTPTESSYSENLASLLGLCQYVSSKQSSDLNDIHYFDTFDAKDFDIPLF